MKKEFIWSALRLTLCGLFIVTLTACSSQQSVEEEEYTGMKMTEQLIRALAEKKPGTITDLGELISYVVPFQKTIELMNAKGEVVLSLEIIDQVPHISHFSEGLAKVKSSDGVAFINSQGEFIIPFGKYDNAFLLYGGIGFLVLKNNRYGVVDLTDCEKIPVKYDRFVYFGSHVYMCKDDSSYDVFDTEGNLERTVSDLKIYGYNVDNFEKILFYVLNEDSKTFLYEKSGKRKQLDIDDMETDEYYQVKVDEKSGLIKVSKNGKIGYINTNGEMVIPCEYELTPYSVDSDGYGIILKKNNKYGVLDYDGSVIWPFEYDAMIEDASKSFITLILPDGMNGSRDYTMPKKTWQTDTIEWYLGNILGDYIEAILSDNDGSKHYGIANDKGELVVPCVYDEGFLYDRDLNVAYIEGYGEDVHYFDLNNGAKKIWDGVNVHLIQDTDHFYRGVEVVNTKEGMGLMRKDGSFVFEPCDCLIMPVGPLKNFFIVESERRSTDYAIQVIDIDGNDIIKLKSGVIKRVNNFLDGFYFTLRDGETYFVTGDGDVFNMDEEFITTQEIQKN